MTKIEKHSGLHVVSILYWMRLLLWTVIQKLYVDYRRSIIRVVVSKASNDTFHMSERKFPAACEVSQEKTPPVAMSRLRFALKCFRHYVVYIALLILYFKRVATHKGVFTYVILFPWHPSLKHFLCSSCQEWGAQVMKVFIRQGFFLVTRFYYVM